MSLSDKQAEFLINFSELIHWCNVNGYKVTGGELFRTQDQQDIYLSQKKTTIKHSKHQDKLAIDLNLIINGRLATPEEYRPLGEYWEFLGGRWGGRFGVEKENYDTEIGWDSNHFEWS